MTTTDDPLDRDFPGRPDHPDFAWLSHQVIANDTASQAPGFSVGNALAGVPIDAESLTYFAQNRAKMAMRHLTDSGLLRNLPFSTRMAVQTMIAGANLDSFYLGAQYGRHVAEEGL